MQAVSRSPQPQPFLLLNTSLPGTGAPSCTGNRLEPDEDVAADPYAPPRKIRETWWDGGPVSLDSPQRAQHAFSGESVDVEVPDLSVVDARRGAEWPRRPKESLIVVTLKNAAPENEEDP
jgi:hypothetical protein